MRQAQAYGPWEKSRFRRAAEQGHSSVIALCLDSASRAG
jgi:hypothetical protein